MTRSPCLRMGGGQRWRVLLVADVALTEVAVQGIHSTLGKGGIGVGDAGFDEGEPDVLVTAWNHIPVDKMIRGVLARVCV